MRNQTIFFTFNSIEIRFLYQLFHRITIIKKLYLPKSVLMINSIFSQKKAINLFFIISLLVCAYWITVQNVNVYDYVIVGAIFEMTSILFLGALFSIPLLVVYLAVRNKLKISSKYYISFFLTILTIFVLFTVYN